MRSALVFVMLVVPAAGCGPTLSYSALNPAPHALVRHEPTEVEVYTVAHGDRPFVELGVLELDHAGVDRGPAMSPDLVQRLRREAGKMGCDAIVVSGPNAADAGLYVLSRYRATCIVYR